MNKYKFQRFNCIKGLCQTFEAYSNYLLKPEPPNTYCVYNDHIIEILDAHTAFAFYLRRPRICLTAKKLAWCKNIEYTSQCHSVVPLDFGSKESCENAK